MKFQMTVSVLGITRPGTRRRARLLSTRNRDGLASFFFSFLLLLLSLHFEFWLALLPRRMRRTDSSPLLIPTTFFPLVNFFFGLHRRINRPRRLSSKVAFPSFFQLGYFFLLVRPFLTTTTMTKNETFRRR